MKRLLSLFAALALLALPLTDAFVADAEARGGRGGGSALRGAGRSARSRKSKNKKNQAKLRDRRSEELRDALRSEAADDRL